MQNLTNYLILLSIYSMLLLIFIVFNMINPKRYLQYMIISHIFGIFTTISLVISKVIGDNITSSVLIEIFFVWSHIFAFISIIKILDKKIPRWVYISLIIFTLIDVPLALRDTFISITIHKIGIMSVYLLFAILFYKETVEKTYARYLIIFILVIFPITQYYFAYYWFSTKTSLYIFDQIAYVLQTLTLSITIILLSFENTKSERDCNEKRLNEIYVSDKLKTEFFANISHELRTPINILFSSIQLFELYTQNNLKYDENKIADYLKVMRQNSCRLIKLVNNLTDMSKIEAGFLAFEERNYNIVQLVEDTTMSVIDFAKSKDIELIFDTEFEEKIISCDAEKVERIILNLLSNAVKFTKPFGQIEVKLYELEENICISVKDNGIGIPKGVQDIIYDRFRQVSNNFVKKSEGSGIGLALVKSLVEMHGGHIYLESEVGIGSNFTISFPNRQMEINNNISSEIKEIHSKKIEIEFSDIESKGWH